MSFDIKEFGDSAVILTFGQEINEETHYEIVSFVTAFKGKNISGVLGIVSAYTTVTIQYDFLIISIIDLKSIIEKVDYVIDVNRIKNIIEVPVCYDLIFALDMEHLCLYSGLSKEEVVKIHTAQDYLVYMIGFTPGFFYLGGLDASLFCPRKDNPRLKIESGSVGIAGNQTGVYSVDSPGGWQLIGKTPMKIYTKNSDQEFFKVKQGDVVRFVEISLEEYNTYQK